MNIEIVYEKLLKKFEKYIPPYLFDRTINLQLERIQLLLEILDCPQNHFKVIQIGGTSGKGSTSNILSHILSEHGYKVGLFLSPFLQILNEICQINNKPIKTSLLYSVFEQIEFAIEECQKVSQYGVPSYFEIKLALALQLFKQQQVDVAILEVGLGGRFDATNCIDADLTGLISVGLDHTEILGNTIEEIAHEKCDIVKKNKIAIGGLKQESTREILIQKCAQSNAELYLIERDFFINKTKQTIQIETPFDSYNNLTFFQGSSFQAHNTACAIMLYECYCKITKEKPKKETLAQALPKAILPGRYEKIIKNNYHVILDGAHNPDKLRHLFTSIQSDYKQSPSTLIIALKQGRDVNSQIFEIFASLPEIETIICTEFENKGIWKSLPAKELYSEIKKFQPKGELHSILDPLKALDYVFNNNQKNSNQNILITGSLFLVGDIRNYWYPKMEILASLENDTISTL